MKTRLIAKQVWALLTVLVAPGVSLAQVPMESHGSPQAARVQIEAPAGAVTGTSTGPSTATEDPLGEWIEKNADRFGLYVETAPRQKGASADPTAPSGTRPPRVKVNSPDPAASTPQAPKESDAIQAFFGNRIFEIPNGTTEPPENSGSPSAKVPDTSPSMPTDKKSFSPPADATKSSSAAAQISAVMKDLAFGGKCSGFATPAGFGTFGKVVIQELANGNANSLLQGTDDLRRACPNYEFLTIQQRSHVWVNVLATMSFLESTCNPRGVGKGPDGKAAGLLQLHAGFEQKAAPGCNRNDSHSPIKSLQCAISIIETQIKRTSALFSEDTHFGVLRPQGDLIKLPNGQLKRVVKARIVVGGIKELPFCQRK
jgi:hypothetical protein